MEHAEDIKLDRVLQHQKLLQKRSGEQSGRTQQQHAAPVRSSPSTHVRQSASTTISQYASPPHAVVSAAVEPSSDDAVSSSKENSPPSGQYITNTYY